MSVEIDARAFRRRAALLIQTFHDKPAAFGDADALVIAVGAQDDDSPYQKNTALQTWLLGYEFTDTVMAVTKAGHLIVHTSTKKASYIEPLAAGSPFPMHMIKRTKEESKLGELMALIKSSGNGASIGMFPKDKIIGKFGTEWTDAVAAAGLAVVDATQGGSMLLAVKDASEVKLMAIAAKTAAAIMQNHFYDAIMAIVEEQRSATHEDMATVMDSILADQIAKFAKKYKFPADADLGLLEWCYFPVVQSGGKYDLRPSASSDTEPLHVGAILCSLGVRYRSYCSNIGRTLLINPTRVQEKNYEFLLEVLGYVVSALRPGVKCRDVYTKTAAYVRTHRPDLEPHLTKSLGFSIGIEFRDAQFALSPKAPESAEVPAGAVFNLTIGLQNLDNPGAKDPRARTYALQVCDTVVVSNERNAVLTADCTREAADVVLFEDEPEEPKPKAKAAAGTSVKREPASTGRGRPSPATTVLKEKTRGKGKQLDESAVQVRREHQRELLRTKTEEGLQRFAAADDDADGKSKDAKPVFRKFEAYRKDTMLPRDAGLRITVDERNQTFLLPVYGLTVPFHINALKNVTKSDEGDYVYLRFNLVSPGQGVGRKEETPFENPTATFIKTLSYRSRDVRGLNDVYKRIQDLKKEATKAESERKDMADIVHQDRLIEVSKFKPVALLDVFARPTMDGKRMPGDLEIHTNGIRYRSRIKADNNIDILFSNIKHLFFQPCDQELIVLLHVHLKHPIMVGKKKSKDFQFYREAQDASFDETGNRRRRQAYGDEDELQQEQDEKRRRIRLNNEFKAFGLKIADAPEAAAAKLSLDIPYRDLSFTGVPFRSNVVIQPTTDCLVHLTEPPFLVISLSEVEIVHLERIQFGLRNFDMVFVFQDFSRVPVHVNSIPASELDTVREWLDSNDILFSEGPVNLNWPAIMKTINENPREFFEKDSWGFLGNGDDDDGSQSEESASEFEHSSEGDAGSSSAYSSADEGSGSDFGGSESGSDAGMSGSASGSGSEDESGEDWDAMEAKTRREEARGGVVKKRGRDDDGDDRGYGGKRARR
ncbi:FACT complex subunit-domain-containing protein [Blastocladiella britannica]|nr:FACT complex subunit-domain-containing protein [Blastocladiella britannica]